MHEVKKKKINGTLKNIFFLTILRPLRRFYKFFHMFFSPVFFYCPKYASRWIGYAELPLGVNEYVTACMHRDL